MYHTIFKALFIKVKCVVLSPLHFYFFLNFKYVNLELLVTYVNLEALNCQLEKIIVLRNEKKFMIICSCIHIYQNNYRSHKKPHDLPQYDGLASGHCL